jgi:hypothetical protein
MKLPAVETLVLRTKNLFLQASQLMGWKHSLRKRSAADVINTVFMHHSLCHVIFVHRRNHRVNTDYTQREMKACPFAAAPSKMSVDSLIWISRLSNVILSVLKRQHVYKIVLISRLHEQLFSNQQTQNFERLTNLARMNNWCGRWRACWIIMVIISYIDRNRTSNNTRSSSQSEHLLVGDITIQIDKT